MSLNYAKHVNKIMPKTKFNVLTVDLTGNHSYITCMMVSTYLLHVHIILQNIVNIITQKSTQNASVKCIQT